MSTKYFSGKEFLVVQEIINYENSLNIGQQLQMALLSPTTDLT